MHQVFQKDFITRFIKNTREFFNIIRVPPINSKESTYNNVNEEWKKEHHISLPAPPPDCMRDTS